MMMLWEQKAGLPHDKASHFDARLVLNSALVQYPGMSVMFDSFQIHGVYLYKGIPDWYDTIQYCDV